MKVGIFGAGFSGKAIGQALANLGAEVWGTTRKQEGIEALTSLKINPIMFDGVALTDQLSAALTDTTHLIISIAPPREEKIDDIDDIDAPVDPALLAMADHSLTELAPNLEWIGYLSTVGVYGNHDGAWIDETTEVSPSSARSRQRVRAEAEWLATGEATELPVGIFRLSGIYGPGRNGLLSAHNGKSRRLVKRDQVFNRIHNADIAIALSLAAEQKAAGLFNITDDEPAPPQDVVTYAHELLGIPAPPEMDFETAELSPMARSFYGENKRVSNAKSKQVLGMTYEWPNYRVALKRMWDEKSWQG